MDAHERVADGGHRVLLEIGQRRQRGEQPAAVFVRMDHMQRLDPGLQVARERFVSEHHVGKARAPSHGVIGHHFDAVQQGGVCRHIAVRAVGMPQRVDPLEDHAMVGLGQVFALGRDVRNVVDGGCGHRLVLFGKVFERTPLLRERDLLEFGEGLVAKAEHAVGVERGAIGLDLFRILRGRKIHAGNHRAERSVEWRDHGAFDNVSLFHRVLGSGLRKVFGTTARLRWKPDRYEISKDI